MNGLKDSRIPEFVRLVRMLIKIPGSSYSNEQSFSVLRRLKTYLRSAMLQDRLNNIAILHVYRDITDTLDLEKLLNEFVTSWHRSFFVDEPINETFK